MRILYVLKHNPWGIGGGCYACRNYLDAFTDIFNNAKFDILYCSEFDSIGEHDNERWHFEAVVPMNILDKVISPITGVMDRFHRKVKELLAAGKYDWCIFDHSSIAGAVVELCKEKNIKTIVINHNFEYDYYRDSHPQWYKRMLVLPSVKRNERKSYLHADFNIFLTKEDAILFGQTYGKSKTQVIIGGCFEQKGQMRYILDTDVDKQNNVVKIVITGTLGNIQNMDGIDYFLNVLYPMLPENIQIVITGKNPPSELMERIKGGVGKEQKTSIQSIYQSYKNNQPQTIKNGNLTLVANPKDIQSIVASCDIYLCPMKLGGGLKLRVMDGFRNGLPVVCHQVSARGYHDFINKGICFSYSNDGEFLSAVNNLCKSIREKKISKLEVRQLFADIMGYESRVSYLKEKIK